MADEKQDEAQEPEAEPQGKGGLLGKIKQFILPLAILGLGYGGAHMIFPPPAGAQPADPLADAELAHFLIPEEIVSNLKGSGKSMLVVQVALDFRALRPEEILAKSEDEAFLNRVHSELIKFYMTKTVEEVRDPNTFAFEQRQVIERLQPFFFPEGEEDGRLEAVHWKKRNIQL